MILFIHFVTLRSMETLEFQKSGIVKCNLCAYEIELAWCQKKNNMFPRDELYYAECMSSSFKSVFASLLIYVM